MSKARNLDQFYTSREIASALLDKTLFLLEELKPEQSIEEFLFLEPSAGDGAFLDALTNRQLSWIASDLDPKREDIQALDFLADELIIPNGAKEVVAIGNPPFGKKSSMAINFVNRSLQYADTVAFVLPLQFRKYLTQKQIHKDAKLILDEVCPGNSFVFNGKPYDVRCCFQVWTVKETSMADLRLKTRPPTTHSDFDAWIYNATKGAEKFFHEEWELAVRRQGWGSFELLERNNLTEELSRSVQWLLLKPHSEKARRNLFAIDYESLAEMNTSVKGFGKTELVAEYSRTTNESND